LKRILEVKEMSLEIEVKAYAKDLKEIEIKLEAKGAVYSGIIEQKDIYFNSPNHDFAETDEALRLREEKGSDKEMRMFLTYKGPKIDEKSKTRVEINLGIDSLDSSIKLLKSLGFAEFGRVSKLRKRFIHEDLEVSLDNVQGLGCFVEVESKKEIAPNTPEVELERDRIIGILEELGLEKFERTSYLELLYPNKKERK
jgi:adenylate cyclase class 2